MAFWLRLLGYNLAARRVGTGSGINGWMDSWELLEDVAPKYEMSHSVAWANQCGCPILDRFGQGKYISDAMRSDRRSKKCEKESEAMQKRKVITHPAVQAEFELQMENFLLMGRTSQLSDPPFPPLNHHLLYFSTYILHIV